MRGKAGNNTPALPLGKIVRGGPQHVTYTDHRVTPLHHCASLQCECTRSLTVCYVCNAAPVDSFNLQEMAIT